MGSARCPADAAARWPFDRLRTLKQACVALLLLAAMGPSESSTGGECLVLEPTIARLTSSGARNGQPFWSPDGTRISFVSNRSGSWQVWAPDGESLLIVTDRFGGQELATIDVP